jgi:hypothetical protein
LALQPGQGRRALPVRSATFGAVLALAALTASLVFAASLAHLLGDPRLSGYTWDVLVGVDEGKERQGAAALTADPKVACHSRGGFNQVTLGHVSPSVLILDGSGPARAVIKAGRAPVADDEIALGASTLRATRSVIGSTVDVALDDPPAPPSRPFRMRVVGSVIFPPNPFEATRLGEGRRSRRRAICAWIPAPPRRRSSFPSSFASPPASAARPGSSP